MNGTYPFPCPRFPRVALQSAAIYVQCAFPIQPLMTFFQLFIYLFINQTLLSATYTMTNGQC